MTWEESRNYYTFWPKFEMYGVCNSELQWVRDYLCGCIQVTEIDGEPKVGRASKSPDFSGDLPIFDKIMKISRF